MQLCVSGPSRLIFPWQLKRQVNNLGKFYQKLRQTSPTDGTESRQKVTSFLCTEVDQLTPENEGSL